MYTACPNIQPFMPGLDDRELLEAIGNEFRAKRNHVGMNQTDAAKGVSKLMGRTPAYKYNTIQKIEAGRFSVKSSKPFLTAYAKLLGLDFSQMQESAVEAVEREATRAFERGAPFGGDAFGRLRIPAGEPTVQMRFAGELPCLTDWRDPLDSDERIDVEAVFGHPRRFAAKIVGDSCYPKLQQGDLTVWHIDPSPPYGLIVLAERQGGDSCTISQLGYDPEAKGRALKSINLSDSEDGDGGGWNVIARLVAVLSAPDDVYKGRWFTETGLRPEHLDR